MTEPDAQLRESRAAAGILGMIVGGGLSAFAVFLIVSAVRSAPSLEHAAGGLVAAALPAVIGVAVFIPAFRKWKMATKPSEKR